VTTSTDITALKGRGAATAEQAQRAVKAFRALQPTLTAYARNLTGRNDVRVEMAAQDNGSTDGKRIFFRPPIALGVETKHQRSVCGRRDKETLLNLCAACDAREDVLVTIYHEIAHIAFESFADVDSDDAARVAADAAEAAGGVWAKGVSERIRRAPSYQKRSYIAVSNLVSPFMPLLWNALEDARVNDEMFSARPGTKVMFDSNTKKIFRDGVEQVDPATGQTITKKWDEYPANMQILVGLFCKASGFDYRGWFAPQIERALADETLTALINRMGTVRSAAGVYNLCFPILTRLRELGFCKMDDEPDEPTPEPEEQPDEASDDEPSVEEDDSEDDDPTQAEEPQPEGESDDESDAGSSGDDREESGSEGDSDEADRPEDGEAESEAAAGQPDAGDAEDEHGPGDPQGSDGDSEGDADPSAEGGAESDSGRPDLGGDEEGSVDESDAGEAEVPDEGGAEGSPQEEPGEGEGGEGDPQEGSDDAAGGADAEDGGEAGFELGSDGDAPGVGEGGGSGDTSDDDSDEGESGAGSEGSEGGESGADDDAPSEGGITGTGDIEGDKLDVGSGGGASAESGEGSDDDSSDGNAGEPRSEPSVEAGEGPEHGSDGQDSSADDGDRADDSAPAAGAEASDEDEPIDTGADLGRGGTELIEDESLEDKPLEMGTPEDAKMGLLKFGDHEEKPKTAQERADEKAIDQAIIQGLYFETPSRHITGVREHRWGVPQIIGGFNFSQAWDEDGFYSIMSRRSGREADMTIAESVLGPALMRMRVAFADNQRGHNQQHLKSGKVNGRVLGKRASLGDPRLFRKKIQPGKKNYLVVIGMDVSGSTAGVNIVLEKQAVMAQAELCRRMGIPFAIYAHSGNYWSPTDGRASGFALDVYIIKEEHEPWDKGTQERLTKLGPDSANLDGHFLEYLRKRADESTATDTVILYYSDGKMPAENHDEELEILQREIAVCKKKNYTLLGVGIRTDSPARHGLDTVQVDSTEDVGKVVKHLEKRLTAASAR
jgi:hypothetical protein